MGATATDSVDGDISANVVVGGDSVDTAALGDYTNTYDVTDATGNKAVQITRKVTVTLTPDETPPVITLTGDASFAAEAGVVFTDPGAKAYDDRDGDISAQLVVVGEVDSGKQGTYPITYNVSDAADNAAIEVVRTVTVADTIGPVIALKGESSITLEVGSVYNDAGATANDSFEGDLSAGVTSSGTVDANKTGTYEIKYNVSDSTGNKATETIRTIVIEDTTIPVITLVGEAEMSHEAATDFTDPGATVTDNLDTNINVISTGSVDTRIPGTYTLTYAATDTAGNKASDVTRKVIVSDTTLPVITLDGEADVTIEYGATYSDPGATAQDTLDGDITGIIQSTGAVDTSKLGEYSIVFNVADAAGNKAVELTRKVTVVDSTPPVILLVGEDTMKVESGSTFADPGASASDNLDGDLTSSLNIPGSVNTSVTAPIS